MKKIFSFFSLFIVLTLGIVVYSYSPWDVREKNNKYEVLEGKTWKEVQPVVEVPKLEEFVDGSVKISKYKKISPYKYFVEKKKNGSSEWVLWSVQDFENAKKVSK